MNRVLFLEHYQCSQQISRKFKATRKLRKSSSFSILNNRYFFENFDLSYFLGKSLKSTHERLTWIFSQFNSFRDESNSLNLLFDSENSADWYRMICNLAT